MLITTSKQIDPLKVTLEGSQIVCTHSEVVTPLLQQAYEERKDDQNGWTRGRHFRKIADLSPLAFLNLKQKYPEIDSVEPRERQKAWRRALRDPEFELFRTTHGGV